MTDFNKNTYLDIPKVSVYTAMLLGVAGVCYAFMKFGYVVGGVISCIPFLLYGVLFAIKNPYWAFTLLFVMNYFIMGIIRYFPSVQGGILMDCLIMFNLFVLLLGMCYKKVGWERARNGLTLAALIWLAFCFLELFNPQSVSVKGWAVSIRGYAIYFFFMAVFTPVIFYRYKDLKRILVIWSVLTLLAAFKSYIQRHYGFDAGELHWLYVRGGMSTHIINTGTRYFSFFSDAANFGSGMGLSMVVFSICSLAFKNKWTKLYFLGVAFAAAYGMVISGTRSALAVPFAGYALYIVMSKNIKVIVAGSLFLAATFVFLNFTTIGHSNALIRRARSAFNTNDASFNVRLQNQKLMREYMKDKPFGVGLGHGGGKAKEYAPNAYLSQIPTDSWFVMIWVETGIVGLMLHLGILFYVLARGMYLVMFRLKDRQLKIIIGSLTAGIFGIMVTSYANEILGQFPTGIIIYMSMAFIFISPSLDKEIEHSRKHDTEPEHEYLHD